MAAKVEDLSMDAESPFRSSALALKVVTDANKNMVVPKRREGRRGDVGE